MRESVCERECDRVRERVFERECVRKSVCDRVCVNEEMCACVCERESVCACLRLREGSRSPLPHCALFRSDGLMQSRRIVAGRCAPAGWNRANHVRELDAGVRVGHVLGTA